MTWASTSGWRPSCPTTPPPSTVLNYSVDWRWADLDQDSFIRLGRNYGKWGECNSAPDSSAATARIGCWPTL